VVRLDPKADRSVRASRFLRGARRRRVAALVSLVVVVLVGVVVAVRRHDPAPVPAKAAPASSASACSLVRTTEQCSSIDFAGSSWRYSLLRPEQRTNKTVIVDLGGPGTAVLSGQGGPTNFRQTFPEIARLNNLLFVEEPWVTRQPDEQCVKALSEHYRSARSLAGSNTAAARQVRERCEVGAQPMRWGFDPGLYPRVVSSIAKSESLELDGFIGHSFGSARLAYLSSAGLKWAVLTRPFPVGATGQEIVSGRAKLAGDLAAKMKLPITGPSTKEAKEAKEAKDATVPGRSLKVTQFDRLSAQLEVPYLSSEDLRNLPGILRGAAGPGAVAELSDTVWRRYGSYELSPAYLAYLDETCATGGEWPQDAGKDGPASLVGVLLSAHLPCGGGAQAKMRMPSGLPVCAVTSAADAVTSEDLFRQVTRGYRNITLLESAEPSHESLDRLDDCYERIAPQG
jgi:hypothetical protein